MRKLFVLFITLALLSSASASAQVRAKKRRAANSAASNAIANRVEPLRSIGGELNGRTVAGQFQANGRDVPFTFTFTRAEMIGDRLQLSGDFALGARVSQKLQSRLIATMATADNP